MSISKMPYCSLSEQKSETEAALPKAEGPLFPRFAKRLSEMPVVV